MEVDLYRENGRCMSAPETISRAKAHAITCAEARGCAQHERTLLCAAHWTGTQSVSKHNARECRCIDTCVSRGGAGVGVGVVGRGLQTPE